jgi:hypothetical protein
VVAVCAALLLVVGVVAVAEKGGKGSDGHTRSAQLATGDRKDAATSAALDATSTTAAAASAVASAQGTTQPGKTTASTIHASMATGLIPAGKGVHGVTDKAIQVGIWTQDSAVATAGMDAITGHPGTYDGIDGNKSILAVVDYINKHGGVAGRTLQPIIHTLGTMATKSQNDQEWQKACSDWSEDHHVFAFLSAFYNGLSCGVKTNTVVISDLTAAAETVSDAKFKDSHGLWYGPTLLVTERQSRNTVEGLWQQGFFAKDSKVGIMIEDTPQARDGIAKGAIPALAAHGIKPVTQIVYQHFSDASWSNFALQLQNAHVDRILWSPTNQAFLAVLMLMKAADNQHYYPHWGLASDAEFAVGAALAWPRSQMINTQGIGWNPGFDTYDTNQSGSVLAKACQQIVKDSGQTGASVYCEPLFFLQFALNHATEVSTAGMADAVARLGTTYPSVTNLEGKTSFGANRHDGPSVYRDVGYDSRCANDTTHCFKYTSPSKPID